MERVHSESQMRASQALVLNRDVTCSELVLSDRIPTRERNPCCSEMVARCALLQLSPHLHFREVSSPLFFFNVEWNNQL